MPPYKPTASGARAATQTAGRILTIAQQRFWGGHDGPECKETVPFLIFKDSVTGCFSWVTVLICILGFQTSLGTSKPPVFKFRHFHAVAEYNR